MGEDRQAEGEKERRGRDVSAGSGKGKAVQYTLVCQFGFVGPAGMPRHKDPLYPVLLGDESDDDNARVSSYVNVWRHFERKTLFVDSRAFLLFSSLRNAKKEPVLRYTRF